MFWPPGPSVESSELSLSKNKCVDQPSPEWHTQSNHVGGRRAPFERSQPTMHEGVAESKVGCEIVHPHRESIQPSVGVERS